MRGNTRRKITGWGLTIALVIIGIMIAIFVYWGISGREVLVINNQPFPVRTIREHAKADGVIILKVSFCKKIKNEGKVRVSFVSASREIFLTYVLIFNTNAKEVSRENNAYIRGVACILSINAAGRSQNDIERCWRAVQKETGIPVRRYDKELTN
jgi:hypothetical protein